MDSSKHQALPESPLKKAKSFIAYSSSSPSSSSIDLSGMSMNMAAATDLLVTSLTQATDADPFYNGIIQMIGTCNTMITMQSVSIKNLEEKYAKSIVMPIEKLMHLSSMSRPSKTILKNWKAKPRQTRIISRS
eukprot:709426_1